MEEWIKINGQENYSISTLGRVRHDRLGREIQQIIDRYGRPKVLLGAYDDRQWYIVEELMGWHFIPRYSDRVLLEHMDGNLENCALGNLRPSHEGEWRTVPEFSDYEVNAESDVRRIGSRQPIRQTAGGNVVLYDRGMKFSRSVSKLRRELFGR